MERRPLEGAEGVAALRQTLRNKVLPLAVSRGGVTTLSRQIPALE